MSDDAIFDRARAVCRHMEKSAGTTSWGAMPYSYNHPSFFTPVKLDNIGPKPMTAGGSVGQMFKGIGGSLATSAHAATFGTGGKASIIGNYFNRGVNLMRNPMNPTAWREMADTRNFTEPLMRAAPQFDTARAQMAAPATWVGKQYDEYIRQPFEQAAGAYQKMDPTGNATF